MSIDVYTKKYTYEKGILTVRDAHGETYKILSRLFASCVREFYAKGNVPIDKIWKLFPKSRLLSSMDGRIVCYKHKCVIQDLIINDVLATINVPRIICRNCKLDSYHIFGGREECSFSDCGIVNIAKIRDTTQVTIKNCHVTCADVASIKKLDLYNCKFSPEDKKFLTKIPEFKNHKEVPRVLASYP